MHALHRLAATQRHRITTAIRVRASHSAIRSCVRRSAAAPLSMQSVREYAAPSSSASVPPAPSSPAASSVSGVSTLPPLLVVLGCTGCGKTNLSLALARRYNAEIISTDSMQLYAGLPIASNQLSESEAGGVRHHMLGVLPPTRSMHVRQFRRAALRLLDDIAGRGHNVVLAGGTFYYIESVIFNTIVGMETEEDGDSTAAATAASRAASPSPATVDEAKSAEPAISVEELRTLDPSTLSPQLQSLRHFLASGITPDTDVAAACSSLLTHPPEPQARIVHAAAVDALLRHLCTLTAGDFQRVLSSMPPADVRNYKLVAAVLDHPKPQAASGASAAAASTAAASSSCASNIALSVPSATPPSSPFPPAHLYELLQHVDATTAQRLHPNDARKLRRALTIFVEQRGARSMSQLIQETGGMHGAEVTRTSKGAGAESEAAASASTSTHPTRRVQAIWLDCLPDVLDRRLDARVDDMMRRGMLAEAEALYKRLWARQVRVDRGGVTAAQDDDDDIDRCHYDTPLDPGCSTCANVLSNDLPVLPLPPATASVTESAAVPAAPFVPSPAHPDYLGPGELRLDWERGIGQTLGFKEFRPYFALKFHTKPPEEESTATATSAGAQSAAAVPPVASSASAESSSSSSVITPPSKRRKTTASTVSPAAAHAALLQHTLSTCIQSLKAKTRTYARVQNRWITKRLWPAALAAVNGAAAASDAGGEGKATGSSSGPALSILRLDASDAADPAAWQRDVLTPALAVCDQFMAGESVDLHAYSHLTARLPSLSPPVASSARVSSTSPEWVKRRCDACDVVCNGPLEWEKHLISRKHRSGGVQERERIKQEQMAKQEEVRRARQEKKQAAAAAAATAAAGAVTEAQNA